jgi:hypothetical protein
MLEGFDHLQVNKLDLPQHLEGIKNELGREWAKQNKATPKQPAARTKRKADTAANAPVSKKTKCTTAIKSEETSEVAMPPPPSPKPLGNLKGKYAIETDFACCDEQTDPAHDYMCNIVLSPRDKCLAELLSSSLLVICSQYDSQYNREIDHSCSTLTSNEMSTCTIGNVGFLVISPRRRNIGECLAFKLHQPLHTTHLLEVLQYHYIIACLTSPDDLL